VKNPLRRRWTVFERLYSEGYAKFESEREMPDSRRWTWKAAVRRSTEWSAWWRRSFNQITRLQRPTTYVVRKVDP
jgi:hypothetical protein